MTVFKNYFKIAKTFLPMILMYTGIFIGISIVATSSNQDLMFSASKPNVVIINNCTSVLARTFEEYVKSNSEIVDVEKTEEKLRDALFIREIDCVLTIPQNIGQDIIEGKSPKIEILKVPDSFSSEYAEMLYNRFWNIASVYAETGMDQEQIAEHILEDLKEQSNVTMIESNQSELDMARYFYNFANYALIGICVYVVGMIIIIFTDSNIKKRNVSSPVSHKKFNRQIFLANACIIFLIWIVYVAVSFIMYNKAMCSNNGILFIINSFSFSIVALSIAFLVGNLVKNKEAQNGIVNVLALGSSFICGAFVPQEMLGNSVLSIAKILPSYWYIKNNDDIAKLVHFDFNSIQPIIMNMGIVLLFAFGFFVITNIVSKMKLRT